MAIAEASSATATVTGLWRYQGDLPRDNGILRTAATFHEANVGVYCAVRRGGTISRGDAARIE